jgi:hypothetical protein
LSQFVAAADDLIIAIISWYICSGLCYPVKYKSK